MARCILCHDTGYQTHYEYGSGGDVTRTVCGCKRAVALRDLSARLGEWANTDVRYLGFSRMIKLHSDLMEAATEIAGLAKDEAPYEGFR